MQMSRAKTCCVPHSNPKRTDPIPFDDVSLHNGNEIYNKKRNVVYMIQLLIEKRRGTKSKAARSTTLTGHRARATGSEGRKEKEIENRHQGDRSLPVVVIRNVITQTCNLVNNNHVDVENMLELGRGCNKKSL